MIARLVQVRAFAVMAVLIASLLAGCAVSPGDRVGEVNLSAIGDDLAGRLVKTLQEKGTASPVRLRIRPLVSTRGDVTSFGRVIADHLGSALVDRGFRVSSASAQTGKPTTVAVGSYAVAQNFVYINVGLRDQKSGDTLAAARKRIPRTDDVNALLGKADKVGTGPLVPGFEKRFNDSMCCMGPADVWEAAN